MVKMIMSCKKVFERPIQLPKPTIVLREEEKYMNIVLLQARFFRVAAYKMASKHYVTSVNKD